jgi:hypothetical protein
VAPSPIPKDDIATGCQQRRPRARADGPTPGNAAAVVRGGNERRSGTPAAIIAVITAIIFVLALVLSLFLVAPPAPVGS